MISMTFRVNHRGARVTFAQQHTQTGRQAGDRIRSARTGLGRVLVLLGSVAVLVVPLGGAATAATETCGDAHVSQNLNPWTGGPRAGAFNMKVRYCWNGDDVTSVGEPELWGSITTRGHLAGWTYDKSSDHFGDPEDFTWSPTGPYATGTAPVHTGKTIHARGRFEMCVAGIKGLSCVQSVNPTLELKLKGNGRYTAVHSIK